MKLKIKIKDNSIEIIGNNLKRFNVTLSDIETLENCGFKFEVIV